MSTSSIPGTSHGAKEELSTYEVEFKKQFQLCQAREREGPQWLQDHFQSMNEETESAMSEQGLAGRTKAILTDGETFDAWMEVQSKMGDKGALVLGTREKWASELSEPGGSQRPYKAVLTRLITNPSHDPTVMSQEEERELLEEFYSKSRFTREGRFDWAEKVISERQGWTWLAIPKEDIVRLSEVVPDIIHKLIKVGTLE
nr:uncharacterized protein CI109_001752 [Kwoniella shandongensis]KAA5529812.1 hypothetical protein CI109_001752 [Kwoniella shandongensis]